MPMSWRTIKLVPQGPALSSSSHQMENGSSSAPFPVRAGAWLSTAPATSTQPRALWILAQTERSLNSLRMERALFSPAQTPSRPAHIPLGLLLTGAATSSFPRKHSLATREATQFSNGVPSTFATGLTFPRGLAFDSSGNLFVAEAIQPGDILKFFPDGTHTVFASGFGRPEFLTFGPPR